LSFVLDTAKQEGPALRRGPRIYWKDALDIDRPFKAKMYYFPRPVPASLALWSDGLGTTPLLVWGLVAAPVVTPGFMFDLVAFGPTLPSLDAPGAGCVCAGAIAVVPNSTATTRAETAGLDRMTISSFG
jgi:hypothetical protein